MPGFNGYTSLLTLASFQCKYKKKKRGAYMFREEYQAVCGAAKKKVEFLEKNPLGKQNTQQLLSWQECLSDWAAC